MLTTGSSKNIRASLTYQPVTGSEKKRTNCKFKIDDLAQLLKNHLGINIKDEEMNKEELKKRLISIGTKSKIWDKVKERVVNAHTLKNKVQNDRNNKEWRLQFEEINEVEDDSLSKGEELAMVQEIVKKVTQSTDPYICEILTCAKKNVGVVKEKDFSKLLSSYKRQRNLLDKV